MSSITRSAQSETDYLEIWLYISQDNRAAADRVLANFEEKLLILAESPGLGQARPELAKNLRSLPVGKYLIFYRPKLGGIELVRVIHGARDLHKAFRANRKRS